MGDGGGGWSVGRERRLCNTGMIYVDPSAWPFAIPHVRVGRVGGWGRGGRKAGLFSAGFLGGKN